MLKVSPLLFARLFDIIVVVLAGVDDLVFELAELVLMVLPALLDLH